VKFDNYPSLPSAVDPFTGAILVYISNIKQNLTHSPISTFQNGAVSYEKLPPNTYRSFCRNINRIT